MNNSRSTKNRRRLATVGGVAVLAASLMALDAQVASANGSPAVYLQIVKHNSSGQPLAGAQFRLATRDGSKILCPPGTWNKANAASAKVANGTVPVPAPRYALTQKQVQQIEALVDPLGGDHYTWLQALMRIASGATSPLSDAPTERQQLSTATNTYLARLDQVQKQLTAAYPPLAGTLDPAVSDANSYTAAVLVVVNAGQNATQAQIDAANTDATSGQFNIAINAQDPILQKATTTVTNQAAIDAANAANANLGVKAEKASDAVWASAGCVSSILLTTDRNGAIDINVTNGVPDRGNSETVNSSTWSAQLDIHVRLPGNGPSPGFGLTATEVKAPAGYRLDTKPVAVTQTFRGLTPVYSIATSDPVWSGATAKSGLPRYVTTQVDKAVVDRTGGGAAVTGGGRITIDTGLAPTGDDGGSPLLPIGIGLLVAGSLGLAVQARPRRGCVQRTREGQ